MEKARVEGRHKQERMRQTLIVANWKMYKTLSEAEEFIRQFPDEVQRVSGVEIVICAPFVALANLSLLMEKTPLVLGAQNMHWEKEGAYTGEISPLMLREIGTKYVIIGHSERRIFFGETNEMVNKKVASALAFGLSPILCVGEDACQRNSGETENVIREQVLRALEGIDLESVNSARLVVAYEPVWAIGTGNPATGNDAASAAAFIRSLLKEGWGETSDKVRILYGGSVSPDNITEFTGRQEIDGALVGSSSLKESIFANLIKAVLEERRG